MNWSIKNILFSQQMALLLCLITSPISPNSAMETSSDNKNISSSLTHPKEINLSRGPAIAKKNIRDMDINDLRIAIPYAKKENLRIMLTETMEKLLLLTSDPMELCTTRFELADLYYSMEEFKKAGKLFKEYIHYYPTAEQFDEAENKMIVCVFNRRNIPSRDMKRTHKTIQYIEQYIKSPRTIRAYKDSLLTIKQTCFKELLAYDESVINHYIIQKKYSAARKRLENSKQDILEKAPELKPRYLEIEGTLAFHEGNIEQSKDMLNILKKDFPNYKAETLISYIEKPRSFFSIF